MCTPRRAFVRDLDAFSTLGLSCADSPPLAMRVCLRPHASRGYLALARDVNAESFQMAAQTYHWGWAQASKVDKAINLQAIAASRGRSE
jgi:hypothetical protein